MQEKSPFEVLQRIANGEVTMAEGLDQMIEIDQQKLAESGRFSEESSGIRIEGVTYRTPTEGGQDA